MNSNFTSESNSNRYISVGEIIIRTLNGIKKHWRFIPILACICSVVLVAHTYKTYTPQYKASATFTVSPRESNISAYTTNSISTQQLEKTFPYIITSAPLTKVVTEDLGLSSMPGSVTASAVKDTNLFTITVVTNNYEMSYNVLKSVINNYPTVAEYVIGDTDIVLVVPPTASAVPINTVSYRKQALLGVAIGTLLSIIAIMLIEVFNTTVRHPDDIEYHLNSKKLGSVIKVVNKKSSKTEDVVSLNNLHVDARFKESIFSIRNSIIKSCEENKIKSFMITSTGAGEGKTTISSNLAISFAKKRYNTIIVDCDLRNPSLRHQFNISENENSLGIVDVVTGKCNLEDALLKLNKSELYILPGTVPVENASELMGSKQMVELIKALEKMFDYVIIDAPPVGIVSDALEIKDHIGGVMFVVRQDYIKVSKIIDAISSFGLSKICILGCVFNMASGVFGTKGYGRYGYNSYGGYGRYGNYSSYNSNGYSKGYGYYYEDDESDDSIEK